MVPKKPVVPDDLGVRIGTPKEAYLEKLRKGLEEERQHCAYTADINAEFLKVVMKRIEAEKKKT